MPDRGKGLVKPCGPRSSNSPGTIEPGIFSAGFKNELPTWIIHRPAAQGFGKLFLPFFQDGAASFASSLLQQISIMTESIELYRQTI